MLDFQHDLTRRHRVTPLEEHVATDHQPDELVLRGGRDISRPCHRAVLEDRDAVAELEDLRQPVADVDDRNARVPKPSQDLEEAGRLGQGQRCRRLIQDEQAQLVREALGDLDDLGLGGGERVDRRFGSDVHPEVHHQGPGAARRFLAIHASQRELGRVPCEDVLRDGQLWDQRALLVHDGDPEAGGCVLIDATQDVAVQQDLAGIRLIDAADDLAQRGLAGAVLAQERVDLAAAHVRGDVSQGLDAWELLPAGSHLEAQRLDCRIRVRGHDPPSTLPPIALPSRAGLTQAVVVPAILTRPRAVVNRCTSMPVHHAESAACGVRPPSRRRPR